MASDGSVKIDIVADDKDASKKLSGVGEEAKDTKKDVDGLGDELDKTSDSLEDVGDSAGSAEKGIGTFDIAVGNLIANGLTALVGKLAECVSSLFSLEEETREYREDMAKLDTAFTTAGHSTDTAAQAYNDFYAILGESDRSVEAVNHLAELTSSEQELAQWSTIAAGVTARFGDSLPIEGLTEAANETAKVGAVTGPLADALTWAGISEDEFNKKLAACNSEQERAALITSTLTGEYSAAAEEYEKNAGAIMDLNRAEAELTDAQANLGATMTPLVTLFKSGLAGAITSLTPQVEEISQGLQDMFAGVEGGGEKVAAGISGILKNIIKRITAALPQIIKMGVELVSSLIEGIVSALPDIVAGIGLLISQIAQALPGLVQTIADALPGIIQSIVSMLPTLIPQVISAITQAIVILCESFGDIIQPIIDALPDILISIVDAIVTNLPILIQGIITLILSIVQALPDICQAIADALPTIVSMLVDSLLSNLPLIIQGIIMIVIGIVQALPGILKAIIDAIIGILSGVWDGLEKVFGKLGEWFGEKFAEAWEAIKNAWAGVVDWFTGLWDNVKNGASDLWEGIKNTFSTVGKFFGDKFRNAWEGVKSVFASWGDYFSGLWDKVKEIFGNVKDKFLEIGGNIIAGIKEGIQNAWDNLVNWFKNLFGDLIGIAKKILGIASPSKEFAYIGEMTGEGVGVGWDDSFTQVESGLQKDLEGMTARLKATVGAENAKYSSVTGTADTGFADLARAVGIQTAGINSLAGEYRQGSASSRPIQIVLDKRVVGEVFGNVIDIDKSRVGARLSVGGAY